MQAEIEERLASAAGSGAEHTRAGRSRAIDALRDALVGAGILEQGLADLPARTAEREERAVASAQRWAMRLTDRCAEALRAAYQDQVLDHPLAAVRHDVGTIGRVNVALPEGFLFYGLFPELYIQLGTQLARTLAGAPALVIGVRSIGTALSAAVAAGLRAGGCATRRYTARPVGDPFAREVLPSRAEARAWREAALRGTVCVAVDEGPGLSGSSLAAVVTALERRGVESSRIHIVCAARPDHLPRASTDTLAIWRRIRWWAVGDGEASFWQHTLPELLGDTLGGVATVQRDLSWGSWAALYAAGTAPASRLPHLERRKLLLRLEGSGAQGTSQAPQAASRDARTAAPATHEDALFAKFIGFGSTGAQKARGNQQLADAGFVTPYVAYAHGMLLQTWCAPEPHAAPPRPIYPPIAGAARYYAYLRRYCARDEPEPAIREHLAELAATVQQIAGEWFGMAVPGDVRRATAQLRHVRLLQGDQRPEPVEWIQRGATVLKCDAGDHFLDHSWARTQDICFDLAGFIQEFALTRLQQRELIDRYAQASGDTQVRSRLPFYRAVYAAHRLAALDTAYHAAQGERPLLEVERSRMAEALGSALHVIGVAECAS
ncbi:MAG TPA: hypothetical protein VHB98_05005 [Chloroflexota bacterium]|nr:hypothetical protein [Chloroflexota bacterium]